MKHENMIQKKAQIFLSENTRVHLNLNNGTFYNGRLFEVTENYLVIHDREDGRKKLFLFNIKNINEFVEIKK